jgi:hypothetical protein
MGGITHAIGLDAMLLRRFPELKPGNKPPSQAHWRWFARACQLKRGVPCALMIEAQTGYLLLVSHLPESIFEFGFDTYDALLTSLDIHPDMHEQPYDALYTFEPNPDCICWQKGNPSDPALESRLDEAAQQIATMSPAQGHAALAELNKQTISLSSGKIQPKAVIRDRLKCYADQWRHYSENTNLIVHAWNAWRGKKPWVQE